MAKLIVFLVATSTLVLLARRSILDPSAYGIFRFFGFETILLLLLRAADGWFRDPCSGLQLLSWSSFLLSAWVAWHSFRMLRLYGSPRRSIENTHALVQQGVYRHIRHPLYTSLILFAWGVFLKQPDATALGLALGTSAFFMAAASYEERVSLSKFGDSYRRYMRETKRFLPYIY